MNASGTFDRIYEMGNAKLVGRDRSGESYLLTFCPYHEDEKMSLLVHKDGWFRCLGCDVSGRIEKLYAELCSPGTTRAGAPENFRGLPPRVPSEPDEMEAFVYSAHDAMLRNASYRWYLEKRGVDGRIETCRLGWHDGWVTVPIFNREDKLEGVFLRAGPMAEKTTGLRFTQAAGQRSMLYCPDWALLRDKRAVAAVFGMFDALTLAELRIPVVTVTGGDRTFTPDHLTDIRNRIIIIPDKKAGEAAAELAAGLGWRGKVKRLSYLNGATDINDYVTGGHAKDLLRELGSEFGE